MVSKSSRKNVLIVLAFLLFVAGLVVYRLNPAIQGIYKLTDSGMNIEDFVIAGEIVDEDGNPLQQVWVDITTKRFRKAGTDTEYKLITHKVDHTFRFEFDGYRGIRVGFRKLGYQAVERVFQTGGEYKVMRITLKRLPATKPTIVWKDFVIAGEVVDEDGNPLQEVWVDIQTRRYKEVHTDNEYKLTTHKVDHSFRFEFEDYSGIKVQFRKPGYRDVFRDYNTGGKREGLKVILRREGTTKPTNVVP